MSKSTARNLPSSIVFSGDRLKIALPSALLFSRPKKVRAMRIERQASHKKILTQLLRHMDCRSGRLVRPLQDGSFVLVTVEYISKLVNLCTKTVTRCLLDLQSVGYLDVEAQPRASVVDGVAMFCGVVRKICRAFFVAMGTAAFFDADKEHALSSTRPLEYRRPVAKVKAGRYVTDTPRQIHKQKPLSQQLEELMAWKG